MAADILKRCSRPLLQRQADAVHRDEIRPGFPQKVEINRWIGTPGDVFQYLIDVARAFYVRLRAIVRLFGQPVIDLRYERGCLLRAA